MFMLFVYILQLIKHIYFLFVKILTVVTLGRYKKRTWEEHTALLEYLVDHSTKQAAQHFNKTEGAIYAWLYSLRKIVVSEQIALNRIRTLQRISPRVRKLTTVDDLAEKESWEK